MKIMKFNHFSLSCLCAFWRERNYNVLHILMSPLCLPLVHLLTKVKPTVIVVKAKVPLEDHTSVNLSLNLKDYEQDRGFR